jgi:Haem-binding domain
MTMPVRRILFGSLFVALAIGAGGAALHPFGPVRKATSAGPLLQGTKIDQDTLSIVERACQNCHSERTDWPWYSHIAPMSWLIEKDVHEAREHMNLSRWQDYSGDQRETLLSSIGVAARTKVMPPRRYTMLHSEARLSVAERQQLYQWTRRERSRRKLDRQLAKPVALRVVN